MRQSGLVSCNFLLFFEYTANLRIKENTKRASTFNTGLDAAPSLGGLRNAIATALASVGRAAKRCCWRCDKKSQSHRESIRREARDRSDDYCVGKFIQLLFATSTDKRRDMFRVSSKASLEMNAVVNSASPKTAPIPAMRSFYGHRRER